MTPTRTSELSRPLRVSLDAARAVAASYVVLHHLAQAHDFTSGIGFLFRFGQEAVITFFLLSGFVIFANERDRALNPRGYYLRRLRRIYPLLIVALIVSTLIFVMNDSFQAYFRIDQFFGTLLGLQDVSALKPGVIVDPYLGNTPLWSLSYELAFYIAFPPILTFWNRNRNIADHVIGGGCCALFALFLYWPGHFSLVGAYFLIWWAGAMSAEAYLRGHRDIRGMATTFFWLLALCALAALGVLLASYNGLGVFPFLHLRHFVIAAIILLMLFGPIGRFASRLTLPSARVFTFVASISYGLYVLHYPILIQWEFAAGLFGFLAAMVLLVLLSYLAEHVLVRLLPKAPTT